MTSVISIATAASTVSPLHVLQHKKDAELSEGAFVRYQPVDPADRSRFSPSDPATRVELGLGYVQAALAALHGLVTTWSYDPPGVRGHVALRSSGGSTTYHFTWSDDEHLLIGGFEHSSGQPTYQAALVALVQAVALHRSGDTAQSKELVERWFTLVEVMERIVPRHDVTAGWERRDVARACRHPDARPHILRVSDALRVCLTYRLPALRSREPAVTAADAVGPEAGVVTLLPGAALLQPDVGASPDAPALAEPTLAAVPASAVGPPPVEVSTPPARPARARGKRGGAWSKPPESSPPTDNATHRTEHMCIGTHTARIQRALARGGPVMLVGPTATGKTSQAIAAALALGFGIEAITLDAGWEADDLFGSYTRTAQDHEWVFVPGPVTRWAERALAGERVALVIDELARGHSTVTSAVMRLMNVHTRTALEGMRLALPDGEHGPFHLVDIRATQRRLVLPCHQVRIIATANQGEQYSGLDLADPAFGRRFTGGWLQFAGYQSDETAQILADALGLTPAAPLIRAMQQVALQVLAYQQKEEALRATLDLATLLAWGRATLHLHADATAAGDASRAFHDAARDIWLDRICPLQGALLDPQVEHVLLEMLNAAAPAALS